MRKLEMQNHAVVIHEDKRWRHWAKVPGVPGCYSHGERVDELTLDIREPIAAVLELLKEQRPLIEANGWVLRRIGGSPHVYSKPACAM